MKNILPSESIVYRLTERWLTVWSTARPRVILLAAGTVVMLTVGAVATISLVGLKPATQSTGSAGSGQAHNLRKVTAPAANPSKTTQPNASVTHPGASSGSSTTPGTGTSGTGGVGSGGSGDGGTGGGGTSGGTGGGGTSGGPRCPVYPAFPDATCTGVPSGVTLTASSSLTVTSPNADIQNLDISGSVTIKASNVTIKNCIIHGSGTTAGVNVVSGNVIIRDSELYGWNGMAIAFDNWAGYNLNIHNMLGDGVKLGSNVTLQDSYMHDFTPAPGAHADGGQLQNGGVNVSVIHNRIVGASNSALFMAPSLGPNGAGPVIIQNNYFDNGNYTLYIVDGNNGQYHQMGYAVTGNHFGRGAQFGAVRVNEPAGNFTAWSGNVYDDNGQAIPMP